MSTPPRSPGRVSTALLLWLNGRPRWTLVVGVVAVGAGGLILPGWPGALLLLVIAALLTWLAGLSWPRVDPAGRVLRVIAVAVVVALAVRKVIS